MDEDFKKPAAELLKLYPRLYEEESLEYEEKLQELTEKVRRDLGIDEPERDLRIDRARPGHILKREKPIPDEALSPWLREQRDNMRVERTATLVGKDRFEGLDEYIGLDQDELENPDRPLRELVEIFQWRHFAIDPPSRIRGYRHGRWHKRIGRR